MQEVWDLGRYPVESINRPKSERQLAERLRRALKDNKLSPEHVAELQDLRENCHIEKSEMMMQEVRGGGRYPRESRCDPNERQAADKLRKRQKVGSLSPEQKAELQARHQAEIDDRTESRKAELDMLVQKVRELGRYPKRPPRGKIDEKHAIDGSPAEQREWKLACDVFTARRSKLFSPEQEAELEALQEVERRRIEAAVLWIAVHVLGILRAFASRAPASRCNARSSSGGSE